jgi:hypothetical protein
VRDVLVSAAAKVAVRTATAEYDKVFALISSSLQGPRSLLPSGGGKIRRVDDAAREA